MQARVLEGVHSRRVRCVDDDGNLLESCHVQLSLVSVDVPIEKFVWEANEVADTIRRDRNLKEWRVPVGGVSAEHSNDLLLCLGIDH